MKNVMFALLLPVLLGTATAQKNPVTPTTLPQVETQNPLPGYPRGNQGSYGENHPNKVLVCHATSAVDNNGYVLISVSRSALDHHLDHEHLTGNAQNKAKRDLEGEYNELCKSGSPS